MTRVNAVYLGVFAFLVAYFTFCRHYFTLSLTQIVIERSIDVVL